jgi:hypothetical protein
MILLLISLSLALSVLYLLLVYSRVPAVLNRPPGPKGERLSLLNFVAIYI